MRAPEEQGGGGGDDEGEGVGDGVSGELDGDSCHEAEGGGVNAVEECCRPEAVPDPACDRGDRSNEDEGGEEDGDGGDDGAGDPGEDVADEGGGGEHRAGCELADGDGIEKLVLDEDAEPVDQVALEEGEEDVSGSVEEGAGLEEDEEEPTEGDLVGGGCLCGDPSPSGEWGDAEETRLDDRVHYEGQTAMS